MKKNLDDALAIAGFIAILIGTYNEAPKLFWFVLGAEFLLFAVLIAWSRKPNDPS